ncbi:helix-turn-helix domain-containing protein [Nonomuraea sp. NPDC050790]|uniref:helix-turn-helix domain-containing protein n=1 Tax=Nonomuraea sp. NPDC050790 TaxID=3364371 RepID=UPI003797DCDD
MPLVGFKTVAAYAPDGVTALALGVVGEVFGGFDFAVCGFRPGPVRTDLGQKLAVEHGVERLLTADLVLSLPGDAFRTPPPEPVRAAFRAACGRGAIVAAHCVGVFGLAASGLLDGRRATTHWRFATELAARYPAVTVSPDELYVDEGRVLTGAGAAAGIDLGLHLVRREHGPARANAIARELVTPPHREGGQAQYIATPVPADGGDERLARVLQWARDRLDQRVSVDELAARALMSRRTFARRFRAATGGSPQAWLRDQRLNLAEDLLVTTDLPIEEVARRTGYGSAALLRERFVERRKISPREYRRTWST